MKAPLLFAIFLVSCVFAFTQPPCNCTLTQGDFSAPLPFMSTNSTAVDFYSYGNPNGSSANTGLEVAETLLVMLHEDTNTGNTSLIIILDIPNDATGGNVDLTVNCLPDSAYVALADDGGELFGSPPTITGDFNWVGCCTDGGVIGGVGCGNTITINPTINSGINLFSLVYGTPNAPTYVNMPEIQCPITINCGGPTCCNDAFDFSATTQDANCEDSNDGSINLETDCATAPSFQWSNNATTEDISGLAPGTYSVTITDANNCTATASYTIGSGPSPQPSITGPTEFCEGDAIILGVDGTYPTYLWSTNSPSSTISVNSPGNYSVTVTDGNGCTGAASTDITENPVPVSNDYGDYCQGDIYYYPGNGQSYVQGDYTITFNDASYLGCDSIVMLHVTEHPSPTTNLFHTICEGESIEVGGIPYNISGVYDIVLQTGFGCDSTVMLDLTVLDPYAFVVEPPSITCWLTQVVIDGNLSIGDQFEWSTINGCIDGPTTLPFMTACSPGTYCLTVTSIGFDSGGPVICEEEYCVEVMDDTEELQISADGTAVTCESSMDGTATANVTGDPNDYLFQWDDPNTSLTQTITDLPGGNYCVIVTSLITGCYAEACYFVDSPEPIDITIDSEDIDCNGEETGTATADASGGAGNFSYEWNTSPVQGTATASNLPAGTYTVVVTDGNGCTEEAVVDILEPSAMVGTPSSVNANCNGEDSGSATISVTGGTGVLTYEWNTTPVQNDSTATNLTAGDYTVLVTDANGCTIEENYTITEPDALSLSETTTQTSCNNTPDGSATVTASGGVGPYTYLWDDPQNQETPTANDLMSGDFTVTVTDANGCTAEITATVTSPNGMAVTPSSVDASCNGGNDGSATVPTTGGTQPYTYAWDDPQSQTTETATGLSAGTYNVTITDDNGCEEYETFVIGEPAAVSLTTTTVNALCNEDANGSATVTASGGTPGPGYSYAWDDPNMQTTPTASGLTAGTYTVLVTDDNGCTASTSVQITEPPVLSLDAVSTDALCNQASDGEATVTPSGGTSPYSYLWDDPNGQTTATASNLLAGTYTPTVTDANGCTEEISITINEPPALVLDTEGTDPDCNDSGDGTATVTPSGGTAPYTYLWDDPNNQTGSTATGLDGGTYTPTVTDANGCSESQSVTLTAPTALSLTSTQTNILCYGDGTGDATVTPTGGTAPYEYLWDDGASQNTATAVNLPAGTYTPTVTDDNGCTAEIVVTLTEPGAALAATGTSTDAFCGVDNGTIDLTVTGGTPNYTYNWNNGEYTVEDPQNLSPGTYSVIVTDANGCTFTTSVDVSTPSGLGATVDITDATCNGEANGLIDVTVTGGAAPFDYDWDVDTNDGNEDFADVGAGNYVLIITDNDGCTFTVNALVEEPDALQATATPSQASCGLSDGSISLVVSGGTGNYTFDWDNDGTGDNDDPQSPDGLPQGVYTGVVTDENGCSITVDATVTVPNGPSGSDISN